jgi:hypothetical protein
MKRQKLSVIKPLALAVTSVFLGRGAYATTQITFGSFTPNDTPNSTPISSLAGYGDYVTGGSADYNVSVGVGGFLGTPNIGLTWGLGYESYKAWDGRGDVGQTDYYTSGFNPIDLVFTPFASAGVLVNQFDLDNYVGGGKANVSWELFDLTGQLATGVFTKPNTGGRTTILTGLTPGDVTIGAPVTLRLTFNAGFGSYLALDNLVFDQVGVPEPTVATLGLLGAGLGAMAMRRRKQA